MSLIVNANRQEISNGSTLGLDPDRTIVIQIVDPASFFPQASAFVSQIRLQFDDVEEEEDQAIQPWQAEIILNTLRAARAADLNVVVHCHAGLCRSGAVVEFALRHLDFQLHQNRERIPNQLVLRRLEAAHGVDRLQELTEALEGLDTFPEHGDILINGLEFKLTCWACPEQYDVYREDGQVAYVRLRYGRLTVYTPDVGGILVYEHHFTDGDDHYEYLGEFPNEGARTYHLNKIAEILNGTSVPTNQA